jgi:transcriptional regulator with XRE-family HTH domain
MRETKPSPTAGPVAREIYRRMVEMKITKKRLAVESGVGEGYVHDLLRGKSQNPQGEKLAKIAVRLGCSVDDLLSPGPTQKVDEDRYTAKTPRERSLLDAWRIAPEDGQDRIAATVEDVLLGALARRSKTKDV